jgi:ribosomal protein L37AE/L43A
MSEPRPACPHCHLRGQLFRDRSDDVWYCLCCGWREPEGQPLAYIRRGADAGFRGGKEQRLPREGEWAE